MSQHEVFSWFFFIFTQTILNNAAVKLFKLLNSLLLNVSPILLKVPLLKLFFLRLDNLPCIDSVAVSICHDVQLCPPSAFDPSQPFLHSCEPLFPSAKRADALLVLPECAAQHLLSPEGKMSKWSLLLLLLLSSHQLSSEESMKQIEVFVACSSYLIWFFMLLQSLKNADRKCSGSFIPPRQALLIFF